MKDKYSEVDKLIDECLLLLFGPTVVVMIIKMIVTFISFIN